MPDFKPLDPKVAEKLGQLIYAGFYTNPETVALAEGSTAVRVKQADLDWALDMAKRCAAADTTDVALSTPTPKWETTPAPASAPKQQTVRVVSGATETQRRAAEIIAHDKVRQFEARYGKGATLDDAREQDLADDYLRRIGIGPNR